MTVSIFPGVVRDGLVVDYDPAYNTSFDGRENLFTYSELLNNASWTAIGSITASANVVMAPDNTITGNKLVLGNGAALNSAALGQNPSKSAAATAYTFSVYVRSAEWNQVRVMIRDGSNISNVSDCTISTATGAVVSSAAAFGTFTNASVAVTAANNNWYRVALTTVTGTETQLRVQLYSYDSVATTGNGTSGIYVWGAQLERSRTASAYTVTTASAVTRSATVTNTVSALYPGTINGVVQYHPLGQGSFYFDNTAGNFISLYTIPDTFWNAGSWSVSSWVRGDVIKTDNAVVGHGSSVGNGALHLGIRNAAVYFGFFGNDWASGNIISANNWYHIVWVYDNAQKQKIIFVNGVQVAQSTLTGGVGYIGTGSNTEIGRYPWDPGYRMQGYIGRTQFYNRALGVSEVSQIFSSLAGRYGYGI